MKLMKNILETIFYILIGTLPITLPIFGCWLLGILINL